MALDELHARRLSTLVTLVENALERIEHAVGGIAKDSGQERAGGMSREQAREILQKAEEIRWRLHRATQRFAIRPQKPDARQTLGAELASLWVILENARPKRLKGYGREFDPGDKADWETLIQELLRAVEGMRRAVGSPQVEDGKNH
jgi:hypothetical protein